MVFGFLRKLFAAKNEVKEIAIEEIERFVKSAIEEKLQSLNTKIKKTYASIEEQIAFLDTAKDELNNAELQNPNISVKEKQFMQGNRDSYIKKLTIFQKSIIPPEEINHRSTETYIKNVTASLENLQKQTSKPYYVLSEFFKDKATTIAAIIKKIDDLKKQVDLLLTKEINIDAIKKLRIDLAGLEKEQKKKQDLTDQIEALQKLIKSLDDQKRSLEKNLKELTETSDFKKLEALDNELKENSGEISLHHDHLNQNFSKISSVLKKYEHRSTDKDMISAYIEDPIKAIRKDANYTIVLIIKKIIKDIDKLGLKEKKKERITEILDKLDLEYFKRFKEKDSDLQQVHNEISNKIKLSQIAHEKHELSYKIQHIKDQITKRSEELTSAKESIKQVNHTDTIQSILENTAILGVHITISDEKHINSSDSEDA